MIVYMGPAVVVAASPLTVLMPLATQPQPATPLNGITPAANAKVAILVRDDGLTYVLGTTP